MNLGAGLIDIVDSCLPIGDPWIFLMSGKLNLVTATTLQPRRMTVPHNGAAMIADRSGSYQPVLASNVLWSDAGGNCDRADVSIKKMIAG
jgi:hypothetical protein